jgi:sugar O-acyltransferase (sialic acid O-acetyltransferase NeuD family)
MVRPKVLLQGGGGHAKVVIDCLHAEGKEVVAIFDEKNDGTLYSIPRMSAYDPSIFPDAAILIAIGNNKTRKRLAREVLHPFINAVHPSSIVSKFSKMGLGCMVLHRAIVQADTVIGNHVILNTGSQVDHDGIIGDFVHIAPRAVLCGNVTVGEGTLIGAGSVVLPGVKIGKWAVIGAGSVITQDVPDHAVVVGVPGTIKKYHNN